MFSNFFLVEMHKIANNSVTTKVREKYEYRFGIFKILEIFFMYVWLYLKTIKTLQHKTSQISGDNQDI